MLPEARRWFGRTVHLIGDKPAYHRLITTPLRSIADHDTMGGHIAQKHISKTVADLNSRLAAEPWRPQVSCFWDEATARACINYVISEHLGTILTWLPDNTQPNRLILTSRPPVRTWTGIGLRKVDMKIVYLKAVKVWLTRISPTDFYVLTAYPN